jgi:alpha-D-ribose 1-methylphosphonate 5-phosphate C-P lyase
MKAAELLELAFEEPFFGEGFLDEPSKREIRRALLKAVALPGHHVPFASRDLPITRGWGTGGVQLSLCVTGPSDAFKCIDQGDDAAVNAIRIRGFVARVTSCRPVTNADEATVIQSRHRIPDTPLRADQLLILQVPQAEPLSVIEPRSARARRMHAERDYTLMWLHLYENIASYGEIGISARYPIIVNDTVLADPSPIPRWDVAKLHRAEHLTLFGAGRDKRVYAIPPHTDVVPLSFDDHPFDVERFSDVCLLCRSDGGYRNLTFDPATGRSAWMCSDTDACERRASEAAS